ncbi:hypothetical protein MTP99_005307 [Tenebrio molitor]|uniref:Uncharacterized protein n=1 Tax=Tenebrio molitor TaxID=7067 RepID=A0A8J6H6R4_TENMO|nr:hypothetical protein GEV33_009840 [Tenebrio molitor]KAJ3619642.1 hypothetical protein MTP99_005307 [Tenebrio molitor]
MATLHTPEGAKNGVFIVDRSIRTAPESSRSAPCHYASINSGRRARRYAPLSSNWMHLCSQVGLGYLYLGRYLERKDQVRIRVPESGSSDVGTVAILLWPLEC